MTTERPNRGGDEHPEEDLLSAYYDDELTPPQRARVAAHLAVCDRCRGIVHGYAALAQAVRAPDVAPPTTLHRDLQARLSGRTWLGAWSRLGAVASVVSLALLTYVFFLWQPPEPVAVAMAYPGRDATSVPLDTVVQIVYPANVDRSAVEQAVQIDPPIRVNKSWQGDTLVLQPEVPLKPDTTYSVKAPAMVLQPATPAPPPAPWEQVVRHFTQPEPPTPSAVPAAPLAQQTQPLPTPQVVTQFRTAPVAVAAASVEPTKASVAAAGATTQPTAGGVAAAVAQPSAPTVTPSPAGPAGTAGGTPKPSPTPEKEPARGFGLLYKQPEIAAALGRPSGEERQVRLVEQRFERGWLLWRSDQPKGEERTFYVLTDDGKWRAYADDGVQAKEQATPFPEAPKGMTVPKNTLGKFWREREDVRQDLGWALEEERPLNGSAQAFAKGTMLGHERKQVYVLYADGRWQQHPDPYVEPTPTPSPVATPSPTPTRAGSGTKTPTPLPGAGAAAGGQGCLITPQHSLGRLYAGNSSLRGRLACALEPEAPAQFVEQPFEGGVMLVRNDRRVVYALFADGTWSAFPASSQGDEAVTGDGPPPPGLLAPERMLGAIWRDHAEVRKVLGWATAPERTYAGVAEGFAGGNLFADDSGLTTAIYGDGRWERFQEQQDLPQEEGLAPQTEPTATTSPTSVKSSTP